jgi:cytochrome c oxidase cbb3-type subunit I/II
MSINLIATVKQGSFIGDQEAQAPALGPILGNVDGSHPYRHRALERMPVIFTVLSLVAVVIGGLLELVPLAVVKSNVPTIASVKPYSPLEQEGRDIYTREGCYLCHSQMIRPFRSETERYGQYSKAGEFVYDHPFQWGSKRTGPDLHRVGDKYQGAAGAAWHYRHMLDPRVPSPGSIMPAYPWIIANKLDTSITQKKMTQLRKVGVPYTPEQIAGAPEALKAQAEKIADMLKAQQLQVGSDREIIALIAYLQRLGTDIKGVTQTAEVPASEVRK